MNTWQECAAAIYVNRVHDRHLVDSELAKASGPDATLACAECGRAMWMHKTRHDTCGQFCWVTVETISPQQIIALCTPYDTPVDLLRTGYRALNTCLGEGVRRDAKRALAAAINSAKSAVKDH